MDTSVTLYTLGMVVIVHHHEEQRGQVHHHVLRVQLHGHQRGCDGDQAMWPSTPP